MTIDKARGSRRRGTAVARHAVADAGELLRGGMVAVLSYVLFVVAGSAILILPAVVPFIRKLANEERRQAGRRLGRPVSVPYRPFPGRWDKDIATMLADPATWRDLAWLAAQTVLGSTLTVIGLSLWAGALIGPFMPLIRALAPSSNTLISYPFPVTSMPLAFAPIPFSIVLGVLAFWVCRWAPWPQARLAAWLLAPTEHARLTARVARLHETRTEATDARAAELRRIERDLHDGAQARLVRLAMSLGMAEEEITDHPETARQLVAEARDSAGKALSELRDLVRGIHPPVLADRGLVGGIEALALASAAPVEVDVQLRRRLPAPVESALYFVVAEALANIAKHADASWAFIRLWEGDHGKIHLLIHDDGRGGANPESGSGLRGIERRLAVFDGQLTIKSPRGGPTELFIELRCPK